MSKNKNRRGRINPEDKRLKGKSIKTQGENSMKSSKTKEIKKETLRVCTMGGLGEIGKNMYVFEYEEDIIIVDMGFKFPDNDMLGVDYIIPDVSYLEERKDRIKAIFITHGHEDHIGGIPYILPKVSAPIYAAKLTIGLIEAKLDEFNLLKGAGLHVIDPEKDKIKVGKFEVEWARVTHSIPDAVAVIVGTPIGKTVFTGDFKFDHSPVDNKNIDVGKLARLGDEGVLLLMSDSTGAESPGYSASESSITKNINRIITESKGRIIIASFSSQINRIQMVIDSAKESGRKLAFSGRSLLRNVEISVRLGYLKIPADLIIKIEDVNKYPDNRVCIMSTGSQGEAMSALSRMASGDHKNVKIKKGDTVLFSSSPIPGNESSIVTVIDDLFRIGAEVVYEGRGESTHHVSGHPGTEELKMMLNFTRPKYFMPVHGEMHHLVHHKEIAEEVGLPEESIFVMDNGDVLEITKNEAKLDGKVPSGIVLVDGLGIGDVGEIVLRDRKAMSTEGIFVVICTVDRKTGKLLSSPDIISRGFIYMRENEKLVNNTRNEVRNIIEGAASGGPQNWTNAKVKIRDKVQDYLYQNTQRRPMVIPVVIEV
ncbi:MAG: ribonuclease J [Patescibacteria group bacterium]|nr:ribonuclease J [Patescibacteria group bacterium]